MPDFELDCNKICECKEPDFNDGFWHVEKNTSCIHCEICGGIPSTVTRKCN